MGLLAALMALGILAAPPASSCGETTFLLRKGANDIGQERFTLQCRPDGSVVVTAHTEVRLPGENSTLDTVMETDSALAAKSLLVNGTSAGVAVSQSIQVAGGVATFLAAPRAHTIPAPKDVAILPPDLVFPFALLALRYDADPNKGVPFSVPVLGGEPAHFEFGGTVSYLHQVYYRLNVTMGDSKVLLWTDADHRLAALYDPSQHLKALRGDLVREAAALIDRVESHETDWEAPNGATFSAREVSVPVSTWRLAGTLFLPHPGKRPAPAAILIGDAGEHDRDDSPPGMDDYQPFRQIAEDLAAHGIAVLRCDKRGAGQSTGLSSLEQATSTDFGGDVSAQVAWLRARPEIDGSRIALLGHGEGGTIAITLAAADPSLAAVVLMAAPGKRGDRIILDQTREELAEATELPPAQRDAKLKEEQSLLDAVLAGGEDAKLPPDARTPWFREFVRTDPATLIRAVKQPTLILHGALDKEITPEQAGAPGGGGEGRRQPQRGHPALPGPEPPFPGGRERNALRIRRAGGVGDAPRGGERHRGLPGEAAGARGARSAASHPHASQPLGRHRLHRRRGDHRPSRGERSQPGSDHRRYPSHLAGGALAPDHRPSSGSFPRRRHGVRAL
jgi:pimeloyl-ACP methyl ester carboxylesterase